MTSKSTKSVYDYYAIQIDDRAPFQVIAYRYNGGKLVVLYQTPDQLAQDIFAGGDFDVFFDVENFSKHYEEELMGCQVVTAGFNGNATGNANLEMIVVIERHYPSGKFKDALPEVKSITHMMKPEIKIWKLEEAEIGKYVYDSTADVPRKYW